MQVIIKSALDEPVVWLYHPDEYKNINNVDPTNSFIEFKCNITNLH